MLKSFFLDDQNIVKYGDYKGLHAKTLINDHLYCLFLNQQWWYGLDERLQSFLCDKQFDFVFGPHAGESISHVAECDPGYLKRLIHNEFFIKHKPELIERIKLILHHN